MKKTVFSSIIIIAILSFPFVNIKATKSQLKSVSPTIESITLLNDTLYQFDTNLNNASTQIEFSIPHFRDITFIDLEYEAHAEFLDFMNVTVQINNFYASSIVRPDEFDSKRLILFIDEYAMLNVVYPKNSFKLLISTTFFLIGRLALRITSLTINTVYQPESFPLFNKTGSNFRKEAVFIPEKYLGHAKGSIDDQSRFTYLLLPRDINQSYSLNLTLTSNVNLEIKRIFLENFGLVTQFRNETAQVFVFNYISPVSQQFSALEIVWYIKQDVDYYVQINGFFVLHRKYKLFLQTEFDLLLYIIISAILPPIFLSKLLYQRMSNQGILSQYFEHNSQMKGKKKPKE